MEAHRRAVLARGTSRPLRLRVSPPSLAVSSRRQLWNWTRISRRRVPRRVARVVLRASFDRTRSSSSPQHVVAPARAKQLLAPEREAAARDGPAALRQPDPFAQGSRGGEWGILGRVQLARMAVLKNRSGTCCGQGGQGFGHRGFGQGFGHARNARHET